jgi:hypothetical protein
VFFRLSNFASKRTGSSGISASLPFGHRFALGDFAFSRFFDACDESIDSQFASPILRSCFLDRDRDTGRPVNKGDGGGHLVDILTAGSARARKNLLKLVRPQSESPHSIG